MRTLSTAYAMRALTFVQAPVHVLVEGSQGARDTPVVKKHRTTVAFPRGSFVKVAPSVLVSSPELLFLQMAKALAFGELVALGFELCGCYPLSDELSSSLVRSPLTTPSRLSAFVALRRQPRWRSVGQTCRAACYGEVGIPYGNRACSLGVYFFARRWFGFAARSPERAH